MIEYEVCSENDKERMTFVFSKELRILTTFLYCDVSDFPEQYVESIERVLKSKKFEEISGNMCYAKINFDETFIEDMFPDDEENVECCTVKTVDLKYLIEDWLKKKK